MFYSPGFLKVSSKNLVLLRKNETNLEVSNFDMIVNKFKSSKGLSLIEVTVAMVVVAVAALGAMGYQYHTARHTRIARSQITATNTAKLLLDDWKSTGGSTEYDPAELKLGFEKVSVSSDFNYGGSKGAALNGGEYTITVDGVRMEIILQWMDLVQDTTSAVTIRQLAVVVQYEDSPLPLILTTYIRLDAASG